MTDEINAWIDSVGGIAMNPNDYSDLIRHTYL